jgi:hypothetical protein
VQEFVPVLCSAFPSPEAAAAVNDEMSAQSRVTGGADDAARTEDVQVHQHPHQHQQRHLFRVS